MPDSKRRWQLTDDHVALLRHANVWWCRAEYGAPGIDPKRPYGNSSVEADICAILGWDPGAVDEDGDPAWTKEQRAESHRIHGETETALQVVLATGRFEPGWYEAGAYTDDWRAVTDAEVKTKNEGDAPPARVAKLEAALRQVRPEKHGAPWGDGWQPWLQLDPAIQASIIDEALAE